MAFDATDHEKEARDLLARYGRDDEDRAGMLAAAQVHATLALVEAVRSLEGAFDPTAPGAFGYSVAQAAEVVITRG
ncbi:MAG TPA: hypothetical protein VGL05_30110 [Kribbella sp.]